MRRTARLVAVAFALCVLADGASAQFKPVQRFTNLVDPVMTALADRANDFATETQERRHIDAAIAIENHGSSSVADDILAVAKIVSRSYGWAPGVVVAPDPPIESAARQVEQQAIDLVQSHVDYLDSWVAEIEQDNPLARLTKTKKLIQKAKDTLSKAENDSTVLAQFGGFTQAARLADQAESSIHLSTPPKSCKLRRLLKGEFCYATSSASGLFRANAGQAWFRKDAGGNVTGLDIYLYYCDGRDSDYEYMDFRILGATPGTYAMDGGLGGYKRGIGFELSMGAGSSVEITTFDVQNQIVEGTFNFNSSGLSGFVQFSGGSFRLEQISQP